VFSLFLIWFQGLQTWNVQTSAQQSLSGPKGQVHALAVSEDGLLFAGTQVFLCFLIVFFSIS
jgi:hypothetical protein